jgi:Fe-S-cluster containining protein
MEQSPLDRMLYQKDFKPFAGPKAFTVLKRVREKIGSKPIQMNDILKAVSSLGIIQEDEIILMRKLQDKYCLRCGDCCRKRGEIRLTKYELQKISKTQKTSYKKMKEELRVLPLGDGTFRLRQPCRFIENNSCSVYQVRPASCRGYPVNALSTSISKGLKIDDCPSNIDLLAEVVINRVQKEQTWREASA